MDKCHSTSNSGEWTTPEWLFKALNEEFGFTVDAAATKENAKCIHYWDKVSDGLTQPWRDEIVFVNPPYGYKRNFAKWMEKCYLSAKNGATVVAIVPARTEMHWWHDYCMKGEIRLFRRRIKFLLNGEETMAAPFGTAVVVWRAYQYRLVTSNIKVPYEQRY